MAGRHSEALEWLSEENLTKLQGWARDGLTDKDIAEKKIGISERTFTRWKEKYPSIVSALKKGKEVIDYEVENALLKRALGYEYEEVMTEVRELPDGTTEKHVRRTKKFIPPDTIAQIFWLKNRKPDQWKDKREYTDNNAIEKLDKILDGLESNAISETK